MAARDPPTGTASLFVSFFGEPLLVPLIVVASVTAYILVFDKPDLAGDPPVEQTTITPDASPARERPE